MQRRRWFDPWVDIYLDEAAKLGLVADREPVAKAIEDAAEALVLGLRVSAATARRYLTEDQVRKMARDAVFGLAQERPGAELMEAPREVLASVRDVGRTVAALSVAGEVFLASGDGAAASQCLHLSAVGGALLAEEEAVGSLIQVPAPWLARIVRQLENAAAALESGSWLNPEIRTDDPGMRDRVIGRLRADAQALAQTIASIG